jgi:CPA2 family monovalent cation:H+ antiporter-2
VPEEAPIDLSGHIILCGFGRVGRVIGDVFGRHGLPWLVVEQDPSLVQELRDAGVPALLGSASNETMLGLAGIDRARALVIATPDPVSTRRLVELARQRNPGLDIVARTHSYAERGELESRGADEAVVGELELALEMSRHALRRFGVETDEAEVLLDSVREGTRPGN